MAQSEWFYRHDGRVYGPVSLEDLRAALALGFVRPHDLVRERVVGDWVAASTMEAYPARRRGFVSRQSDVEASQIIVNRTNSE